MKSRLRCVLVWGCWGARCRLWCGKVSEARGSMSYLWCRLRCDWCHNGIALCVAKLSKSSVVQCLHNYSNVVSWKDCLRNVGWTINNVARKSKCQQAKKGLETSMCRRSFGRIVRRKKPMWPWPWSAAEHVRGGTMRKNKGMLKGGIRINRQSWVEKSVLSGLSRRVWSAWK